MPAARLWLEAVQAALARQGRTEWFGSPPHLALIAGPRPDGFAAFPRDFRPARAELGRAILEGHWLLAGLPMATGERGDPWNRPSPSREFAEALHRFGWLRHLLAVGEEGAREGLRLLQAWREIFGTWSSFSWGGQILERRVVNLAGALGGLCAVASEAEVEMLAGLLARQARQLLIARDPSWRAAERAAAAALAGAALSGRAGQRLQAQAGRRLDRALPDVVLPDGGHASRAPEAGLDLLLDLLSLDDGLARRELDGPVEVGRAIDRLAAALRFFTLADGRLAAFQGGEEADAATIAAALAGAHARDEGEPGPPPDQAPHAGYQRLAGGSIQVMVDVGRPAGGPWSVTACAQPGAIEVVCGGDRLVTNSGWSLRAPGFLAQRLTDAGSTAALGHQSAGEPLGGWVGRMLGPRLEGGAVKVQFQRAASDTGLWLVLGHDGFEHALGLTCERRIWLSQTGEELRGEDRFLHAGPDPGARVIPYVVHFHLAPEAQAVVARDNQSVLIRGDSDRGWWLRNDAGEVRIEPSTHFRDGRPIATTQVMLMGHIRADKGGRVRWKLTAVG